MEGDQKKKKKKKEKEKNWAGGWECLTWKYCA
jgi:hypothetical protein